MKFNDSGLLKDGSIDFDYALKWLCSLKDVYDISDILKDREDIKCLLESPVNNDTLMFRKFQELISKYFVCVSIINFVEARTPVNCSEINVREQLQLFYVYLPVLGLMKFGVTKVFNIKLNQLMSA